MIANNDSSMSVLERPALVASADSHYPRSMRPSPPRVIVWDVPFDQLTLKLAVERISELIQHREPSYVVTANLNYVMLHSQSDDVKAVTADAALILADGQPIVWRSRFGYQKLSERVAGSEMVYDLAGRASRDGWRIYFLGGEPGVAKSASENLATKFPGLQIAGVESPPFRKLSAEEQLEQDQRIRDSRADLLLVAFGQPKGELWIHENYKRLGVPVSIQLGASFDFVAGTAKRAPAFFQKLGLEWAYRMFCDPKRLIPRYRNNLRFLLGL